MSLQLSSSRGLVKFSLIAPSTDTINNAFLVTNWSGELPQSGDYSIVVVMNSERAGNVAYTLSVSIQ